MGMSYQGDPASALLEVLDPEQNEAFLDHYLDVPCDLSNVLFIVTANVLDVIPIALKDRMDILKLPGYIMEEKCQIAKKYLIPRNRKKSGLQASQIKFTETAIRKMIEKYAREAGVRGLENNINKVLRKTALTIAKNHKKSKTSTTISDKNLEKYLGKPTFMSERYYDDTPIGVCTGLAWTAMGGAILYVEAISIPANKTHMKLTGQAGNVMKESAQIALSYVRNSSKKYHLKDQDLQNTEVHLHIPEGATPKDGPSAGITITTALLSLVLNKPVEKDLGMTGELTLTGQVLPVGGLKEKLVAARRAKLKIVIFPKENKNDYKAFPEYLKEGIRVYFVENYSDVFKLVFPRKSS